MDQRAFENRVKILRSIDRDELVSAGLDCVEDDRVWVAFREDPAGWLLRADDALGGLLWALVERRAP